MYKLIISLLLTASLTISCGEKSTDTASIEDTNIEDTDTEDTDTDGIQGNWLQVERVDSCYQQTDGPMIDCWFFSDLSMTISEDLSGSIEGDIGSELLNETDVIISETFDSSGLVQTVEGDSGYQQAWSLDTDYYDEIVPVTVDWSCSLSDDGAHLTCEETSMIVDGNDIHEYYPSYFSIEFDRQ